MIVIVSNFTTQKGGPNSLPISQRGRTKKDTGRFVEGKIELIHKVRAGSSYMCIV